MTATMPVIQTKPFKILAFGFINLNTIDGSAFFMAALAAMLGGRPGVNVDLLSRWRITKTHVVDELHTLENVKIIDPFESQFEGPYEVSLSGNSLDRKQSARLLQFLDDKFEYDAIIIRDNETAARFLKLCPKSAGKTHVYVTRFAFTDRDVPSEERHWVKILSEAGAQFIAQTPEMRDQILSKCTELDSEDIFILKPFVPDPYSAFEDYKQPERPHRLVYTGKFFPDWIPEKILSGFNTARLQTPDLELVVAGDAFRDDPENPNFVRETKWLLNNSQNVSWVGGVTRVISRELISNSDVGIGWRSPSLDASTEFSTKILEYGALGKPSIVNPSPVNVAILGEDYPLYASTMTEFINLLRNLPSMRTEVERAAKRCYEVASERSYSKVSEELFNRLDPVDQYDDDLLILRHSTDLLGQVEGTSLLSRTISVTIRSGRVMIRLAGESDSDSPLLRDVFAEIEGNAKAEEWFQKIATNPHTVVGSHSVVELERVNRELTEKQQSLRIERKQHLKKIENLTLRLKQRDDRIKNLERYVEKLQIRLDRIRKPLDRMGLSKVARVGKKARRLLK
ncbi:hypothetical protein [Micrococcoides hystricis]|uniref:Glycosyltransferase n=1 Tax=Micrococcoides hystricis TaxID=1572761 RepID=A0ABV6PC14_9MICC